MNKQDEIKLSITRKITKGISLMMIALVIIIIVGLVVQLLWNWLIPDLFGLKTITYWQGVGLLVLCKILFGGIGSDKSDSPSIDPKNTTMRNSNNSVEDQLYEKWWSSQGIHHFETFITQQIPQENDKEV